MTRWVPVLVPPDCFNVPRVCQTWEAADYANELYMLWSGEDVVENIFDWTERVTSRRPEVVVLPELLADRRAVMKEIFALALRAANTVAARLRADLQKLEPFKWETERERTRTLDIIREEDARIRRAEQQAAAEITTESRRWERSNARSMQLKLGPAFQQLVYSAKTGAGIPKEW